MAPSGTFENVGGSKSALSGMLTYRRPPPTLLAQCLSDCSLTMSCQEHNSSSKTPYCNMKRLESWQSFISLAPIALRCKSTLCRWTESRRRCICPPSAGHSASPRNFCDTFRISLPHYSLSPQILSLLIAPSSAPCSTQWIMLTGSCNFLRKYFSS